MNDKVITPEAIRCMSYNELIGVVHETNRPPGGRASVIEIAHAAFLGANSKVLDIGCSTGFTTIEIARLTGASVVGIDINSDSISEARSRSKKLGLSNVQFRLADATRLPFADGSFDLVFCGNVTSLVSDAEAAFLEYFRVLRPNGCLAAIPMYYLEPPDRDLVERVRRAIQVAFPVKYRVEATEFFQRPGVEVISESHWRFAYRTSRDIVSYCERVLAQPHLRRYPSETRAALHDVYIDFMKLFGRNLAIMGYSVMLLRKRAIIDEDELFSGVKVHLTDSADR